MKGNWIMNWVKYEDLKAGDMVRCIGFTCCDTSPRKVMCAPTTPKNIGGLYVACSHGKHFLDGQLEDDEYVGVEKVSM